MGRGSKRTASTKNPTNTSSFQKVISKVIILQDYVPEAIVLQCGADSLNGDKLCSSAGHANCVRFQGPDSRARRWRWWIYSEERVSYQH